MLGEDEDVDALLARQPAKQILALATIQIPEEKLGEDSSQLPVVSCQFLTKVCGDILSANPSVGESCCRPECPILDRDSGCGRVAGARFSSLHFVLRRIRGGDGGKLVAI